MGPEHAHYQGPVGDNAEATPGGWTLLTAGDPTLIDYPAVAIRFGKRSIWAQIRGFCDASSRGYLPRRGPTVTLGWFGGKRVPLDGAVAEVRRGFQGASERHLVVVAHS